jgi:hypothetical protein
MTPEQEHTILQLVSVGAYPAEAARNVCLTPHSIYMRRKRDKRFAELLAQAEAKAEISLVLGVLKHAPKDWRAGMAILERRFPDRWARPETRVDKGGGELVDRAKYFREFVEGAAERAKGDPEAVIERQQPDEGAA